ncbi:amidohydrolase family protein [Undibacterium sp.]|jgi:imidazolonepropionase-like amidohydrolase|uniref:amidohydrolase family protein n=1 Tax=Undibacterium sp. TaxID=1914977 RepID=UPI002BB3CFCA|nr:amidohydrolase family protein [Undibacterium sp.]HTD03255.1 amidohydrolase family protein [Undibacterium sp.]
MNSLPVKLITGAVLSLTLISNTIAAQKINADLILKAASVIDVTSGRVLPQQAVVTRGDTIIAVVNESELHRYKAKKVVDLAGKYVMPGLWDTHVHFGGGKTLIEENKALLPLYLANGITTVRDCAGDLSGTVFKMREDIAAGRLMGPTIFMSGPKLEGYKPLWKGTIEVGTPDEVSKALDTLQADHVDFVKITENTLKPEIYLEALRQARARGMRTSAHIPVQLTLEQIFDAGLGTVEHLPYLLRATTPREKELTDQVAAGTLTGRQAMQESLQSYDEATARTAFRNMAAHGTAVVPTLSVIRITSYLDQDDHHDDAYLQYIGKGLRKTYEWRVQRAAQDSPEAIAQRHASFEKAAALLPMLQQEGVSIIAGTDAGFLNSFDYPGKALHDEIALYVNYGLTPQQALQSAVINGPRFLGKLDAYGGIAAGKKADILVLDANPLQDIAATRKIRAVVSKGKLLDRARLDKMLADVKQWVAAH